MSLQAFGPQQEYDHCIARERAERCAAKIATDPAVADRHVMMAERYADQAWSISVAHDVAYVPSNLWAFTTKSVNRN